MIRSPAADPDLTVRHIYLHLTAADCCPVTPRIVETEKVVNTASFQ